MSNSMVVLAHGSGGRMTHELIRDVFRKHLRSPLLATQDDAAVWLPSLQDGARLAMTTDSYVVQPLFFPGADIGKLAVCGTVNDLAMVGARPLYLSAGFILEEGLALGDLERVVESMARTADEAGVEIITGDTKVVDRGGAGGEGLFINTAGVGVVPPGISLSGGNARPGDRVILSGPIGLHGLAIMTLREGLRFSLPLESDCAPLNGLVQAMLQACPKIHCLRDPTRGGLATTLNEIAAQGKVGFELDEESIPVPEGVRAACELLGLDPLYAANEGKLIAILPKEEEERVLGAMRGHPLGQQAVSIGRVVSDHAGRAVLNTALGAHRILDMLSGAMLPRIC